MVITDLATDSGTANDMSLAAGVDLQLTTGINELSTAKENRIRNALVQATKRVCYAVVNSSASLPDSVDLLTVDEGKTL